MYRTLLFNANFFIFWLINLSIQDVEYWRSKKLFIEYSLDKTRITYEFQLNIANEINKHLSNYDKLIMKKDDIEFDFKHSEHAINMELSKEHQTIDQYMMCRSKIYQTIEQKILMGELENEYRNEACQLPVSNNIQDIKVVDQLISKRFYYLRAFNKELFYHQYLWRILEEISYH
ncbi:unnamed protein product [Schistosoma spindalis]|nr:unnamed protein product [Schistosoma spindale]